jgi:hypothetical protein
VRTHSTAARSCITLTIFSDIPEHSTFLHRCLHRHHVAQCTPIHSQFCYSSRLLAFPMDPQHALQCKLHAASSSKQHLACPYAAAHHTEVATGAPGAPSATGRAPSAPSPFAAGTLPPFSASNLSASLAAVASSECCVVSSSGTA